jgi:hypothetical protein
MASPAWHVKWSRTEEAVPPGQDGDACVTGALGDELPSHDPKMGSSEKLPE